MEYLVGALLALAVTWLANVVGFERERSFYSTVLIVVASYYVLFAVMAASERSLVIEMACAGAFLVAAVLGFKASLWLVAMGLVGHGVFDFFHHWLIPNPGVPPWWPGFCLTFDVIFGALLAVHLVRRTVSAR